MKHVTAKAPPREPIGNTYTIGVAVNDNGITVNGLNLKDTSNTSSKIIDEVNIYGDLENISLDGSSDTSDKMKYTTIIDNGLNEYESNRSTCDTSNYGDLIEASPRENENNVGTDSLGYAGTNLLGETGGISITSTQQQNEYTSVADQNGPADQQFKFSYPIQIMDANKLSFFEINGHIIGKMKQTDGFNGNAHLINE